MPRPSVTRGTGPDSWSPSGRQGRPAPTLEVVARIATRDRQVDLSAPATGAAEDPAVLRQYLEASDLIRTDGIVEATAREITKTAKTDVEKARALYEWIVDNTFRDPKVKGCGLGDIQTMLETKNLGGKCADLNALFVGFARSLGIPARDVYGIRVADSADFKSLGRSGDITKAQHCRAEFYLAGHGWIPVDPADVRKVVLEEKPGGLPARRSAGAEGAGQALRRLGDELDGVQLRPRREASRLVRAPVGLPHVSPGRDRRQPA